MNYCYIVLKNGTVETAYVRKKDLVRRLDYFMNNGTGYQFFRVREGERAVDITKEMYSL